MEIQVNGKTIKFGDGCNFIKLSELKPYAKNPKNHDDKDINLIIKSIEKNGWTEPILCVPETNQVLAGNGRLMAAKKMGLTEVPVIYAPENLTDEQKAYIVIASNKLVEVSGYNDNLGVLIDEFGLDMEDFGMVVPTLLEPSDDEESDEVKPIQKKLCQCPQCGHINEEKAFRYHEDSK